MRLLIIGGLGGQVGAASVIAQGRGARVTHVLEVQAALEHLRSGNGAELIMIDVKLDVKNLVTQLHTERFHIPVVGCGFNATSDEAVRAIRSGAKEYIPLPPDEELIAAVLEAITEESKSLIYSSDAMSRVIDMAQQIAPSDASVLITGESGTGKEVIARFLHDESKRKTQKLVSVNCAAIPENLLESELFGHEKGAFTGAVARRIGKFEEASGGTLLLDEISEMDARLQAKLLRAIQEKEIDRVGGMKPVKVDLRILATSNRDLQKEVKEGRFREDLYFRLNVISLHLPPLRERKEDIEKLADHFIDKYAEANAQPARPLSAEARTKLYDYDWPGNVRELENTIHRAVLLARGVEIGPEAIMLTGEMQKRAENAANAAKAVPQSLAPKEPEIYSPGENSSADIASLVGRRVEDVERDLILGTLDHCLGNRTQAANILGISIRTLRNKLRQYQDNGISVPPAREA